MIFVKSGKLFLMQQSRFAQQIMEMVCFGVRMPAVEVER
jgi:hypothetical protein